MLSGSPAHLIIPETKTQEPEHLPGLLVSERKTVSHLSAAACHVSVFLPPPLMEGGPRPGGVMVGRLLGGCG